MSSVPILCLIVIIIAAFAPWPISGIVIVIASGISLATTYLTGGPRTNLDDEPPVIDTKAEAAQDIINRHSVVDISEKQKIEK